MEYQQKFKHMHLLPGPTPQLALILAHPIHIIHIVLLVHFSLYYLSNNSFIAVLGKNKKISHDFFNFNILISDRVMVKVGIIIQINKLYFN